ncbi:hypothetical protein [Actinomyces ruminis]|uniref:hypothetical protein n=1 Tax=Actinomyces ruminis TaxID=1937003 RepID=UPI00211F3AFB|nr:hypothetical protein [Actinomyces ruminis]
MTPRPGRSSAAKLDDAAALPNLWLDEDRAAGVDAPESIAVLVRDRYQRDNVVTGLAHRSVEVRPVDREAVGRGRPVVMTMHRAKGLEFRKVLLFDVSMEAIPGPYGNRTAPRPITTTPCCASARCCTWPPPAPATNSPSPGPARPTPC